MAISKEKLQGSDLSESRAEIKIHQKRGISLFVDKNRRALSALLVFVVLMLIFTIASPEVFLSTSIYATIFKNLPIRIILVVPLVFVIAAGEIDLSFAAILRLSTWVFAATDVAGWNPFLSAVLAIITHFRNGIFEERLCLEAYGSVYQKYLDRTPRWIGLPKSH